MHEIEQVTCKDRSGIGVYSIRLLHELGHSDEYFSPSKIQEIWLLASQHNVLFSDFTKGRIEPFLATIMNPVSIWLEIFKLSEEGGNPVGVAYITNVIPNFDAKGHFAFWDRVAGGREMIIWTIMNWMFSKYNFHRISTEAPIYQHGTLRFIKNLGFVEEGVRREAVLHQGKWFPLIQFGMTRSELEQILTTSEG
jgi:RimJ/RimL family protein N-acetyltransferase